MGGLEASIQRRGEAEPCLVRQDVHPIEALCDAGRRVRRAVVDHDDVVGVAGRALIHARAERALDVLLLVVCGHDHRDFWHAGSLARARQPLRPG
jgi:hypothetical protein